MTYDRLSEIFRRQYDQQNEINGRLPEGRNEQRALAKEYCLNLHGEVEQYLQGMSYRSFLPVNEWPRSTRVLDVVDMFKYVIAIAWTEGISARELFEAFEMKTKMVSERFSRGVLTSKIAGFDIDGVLAVYEDWWTETGGDETPFIESGGMLTLKPMPYAKELLSYLKDDGWSIVLVTARKVQRYTRIEQDTHDWLQANEIPYDVVLYGYDKMASIKPFGQEFKFFVEDNPKHALDVASAGIQVYHLESRDGPTPVHQNIMRIESLNGLLAAYGR